MPSDPESVVAPGRGARLALAWCAALLGALAVPGAALAAVGWTPAASATGLIGSDRTAATFQTLAPAAAVGFAPIARAATVGGRYCDGPNNRTGYRIFDVDSTSAHHVRWGIQYQPYAYHGVKAMYALAYQYINDKATSNTYVKGPVTPSYLFHASIATYTFAGHSARHEVHAGDKYQLFFQAWGNGFYGWGTRTCIVR